MPASPCFLGNFADGFPVRNPVAIMHLSSVVNTPGKSSVFCKKKPQALFQPAANGNDGQKPIRISS